MTIDSNIGEILRNHNLFTGTYSSRSGAHICKPCKANSYAPREGSTSCVPCDSTTQYSGKNLLENRFSLFCIELDEGATECLSRPKCGPEHYRKVFIGCDVSDTVDSFFSP